MCEINKNIPIPPIHVGKYPLYPFGRMEIGDSILVRGDRRKIDSAKAASRAYGKRHGMRFRTMQVDTGVRIWRIEL